MIQENTRPGKLEICLFRTVKMFGITGMEQISLYPNDHNNEGRDNLRIND